MDGRGGGGGGVGDNMHGWASVGHGVDICLSDNTAYSKKDKKQKNKKQKQTNKIQENKCEQPSNKRSQYKIRCIIVLIVLKTN